MVFQARGKVAHHEKSSQGGVKEEPKPFMRIFGLQGGLFLSLVMIDASSPQGFF